MDKIYMLCRVNDQGDDVWLGTFDSEEKLLAAIPETSGLKIEGDRIVRDLTGNLGAYRVKTVVMNQLRSETGEIDLPDHSITVPSTSDWSETYGIAVTGGNVIACTCKAFQYAKSDDPCKHMMAVEEQPFKYGLGWRAGSGYSVIDTPFGTFTSYRGNPGSWRS
jgi:hypothetical protein